MSTITYTDMRHQVVHVLADFTAHFDVDAIVSELVFAYGTCDVDDIPSEDFWTTVQRHDRADTR